ncbi:MAG: M48 family peptidase [Thaumarchaeota archaeon]|nr:M48 family peptidase [Nitrososphaerota archaeon]
MATTTRALEELGRIVSLFSSQELPQMCAQAFIQSAGPSRKWSLGNKLVMISHGTSDARGYRQWQESRRQVKKGAHALYILAPMIHKKKVKNEKTGEEEDLEYPAGFVGIPVFRYEDTEGKPIPEYQPRFLPPLLDVAAKWGVKVEYGPTVRGEGGSYNLATNVIRLCQEDPDTFFHELAHKAHSTFEKLKPVQDPEQETVAQLSACVLAKIYGYDATSFSWNYIASYAKEKTPEAVGKLCLRVLSKVERVITLILEAHEKQELAVPTAARPEM